MQFFLICTSVFTNSIFLIFFQEFFRPKKVWLPAIFFVLPPIVFCLAGLYPDVLLRIPEDLASLAIVWFFNLCALFFCCSDPLRKKMKAALWMLGLYLASVLIFYMIFAKQVQSYTDTIGIGDDIHKDLYYLLIQLTFFFVCTLVFSAAFIFYKFRKKQMTLQNTALFSLFVATQILLMASLLIRVYRNIDFPILWFCLASGVMCIVADFYVFKAFKEIGRKSKLRQQAYFYKKQLDIQLKHYEKLSEYDVTLSHIRHDLKNEISVIQYLLQQKNYQDAEELADEIQNMIQRLEKIECCENKILNALIFICGQKMESQGIDFTCRNLDIPETISADLPQLCETFSSKLESCMKKGPSAVELSGTFAEGKFLLTSKFSNREQDVVQDTIYVN